MQPILGDPFKEKGREDDPMFQKKKGDQEGRGPRVRKKSNPKSQSKHKAKKQKKAPPTTHRARRCTRGTQETKG